MIQPKDVIKLVNLLNKHAEKHNEFFKHDYIERNYRPDWLVLYCYNSIDTSKEMYTIVICKKYLRLLNQYRRVNGNLSNEIIDRYHPLVKRFLASIAPSKSTYV